MVSELSWGFPIALYLFVGGLSAATYYVGVLADISGKKSYRDVARLGSYVVLLPVSLGLITLLVDLGQPLRFWHLLFQNGPINHGVIFLPVSAMSFGTWALVIFSLLCGVAYPLLWLAEEKSAKSLPIISAFSGKESLRRFIGLLGLPFAVLIAVYTGVLLAATSRPVWADTPLLPVLFVLSATSTGIAAIIILINLTNTQKPDAVARLEKGDGSIIKLELAAVTILFITLLLSPRSVGMVKNLLIGDYAVFFWVGFIMVGLLLPLSIQGHTQRNHRYPSKALAVTSSLLILTGGFFLRYIVLLAA